MYTGDISSSIEGIVDILIDSTARAVSGVTGCETIVVILIVGICLSRTIGIRERLDESRRCHAINSRQEDAIMRDILYPVSEERVGDDISVRIGDTADLPLIIRIINEFIGSIRIGRGFTGDKSEVTVGIGS